MKQKSRQPVLAQLKCSNCPFEPDCLFDQKRLGGFKGTTPHYIGYRVICDRAENNSAKKDTITCVGFIEGGLQARMLAGAEQRARGLDGDMITVIAQEGEEIERRTSVGINSMGEIVRPQAEIVEDLKRAGYTIASDHSASVARKDVTYMTKVPVFAEVSHRVNSYSQLLMQEALAEQEEASEAEDAAWEAARNRMKRQDEEADLVLGDGVTAAVAPKSTATAKAVPTTPTDKHIPQLGR